MSYMKQNKKRKQTLESAHYGLQIIFTAPFTTETGRLFFLAVKKRIELSPRGL